MNVRTEFETALSAAAAAIRVPVGAAEMAAMFAHYELLVEANRRFNLTRITTPADAAVKHYADSISLLRMPGLEPSRPLRVLDVGTGAGFPAVPLAIMRPSWQVLAIDGTGKKAAFVADCAARLPLTNLQARHARGSDLAREGGRRFDLLLLRAVTKLADGLEEVSALLTPGGRMVFYKTPQIEPAELSAGGAMAKRCKLTPEPAFDLVLPCTDGTSLGRRLLAYRA